MAAGPRRRRCAAAPPPRPAHGWMSRRRAPEFRRPWSKSRLLARLRVPRLGFGRGPPDHPVPCVLHGRLDLVPGSRLVPPVLVPLPPGPQIGLRVVPGPPHAVARAVEAIAVGGPKTVVVVGAERVWAAGEILEPVVVLGFPGGLPGRVISIGPRNGCHFGLPGRGATGVPPGFWVDERDQVWCGIGSGAGS